MMTLGPALGTGREGRRRLLLHHLPIALAGVLILVFFMTLTLFNPNRYPHVDLFSGAFPRPQQLLGNGGNQGSLMGQSRHKAPSMSQEEGQAGPAVLISRGFLRRLTVGTGYIALGLLALTLLIGPANLLLRRRNPVSTYLRRDIGWWSAITLIIHVTIAFQVHGGNGLFKFLDFFVLSGRPLTNSFGLGNWTGLAALVLVTGLLVISTDVSVRELKAAPWKDLQRLNYTLFGLAVLHTFFYGALLRTTSPYTLLFIFTVITVLVGQAVGIRLWRERHTRTSSQVSSVSSWSD